MNFSSYSAVISTELLSLCTGISLVWCLVFGSWYALSWSFRYNTDSCFSIWLPRRDRHDSSQPFCMRSCQRRLRVCCIFKRLHCVASVCSRSRWDYAVDQNFLTRWRWANYALNSDLHMELTAILSGTCAASARAEGCGLNHDYKGERNYFWWCSPKDSPWQGMD